MKQLATIIAFSICLLHNAQAQEHNTFLQTIAPHHIQLQYAGNIGMVSAGVGYNVAGDKVHITLMDGFTPASVAGSNINVVALKGSYDIILIPLLRTKELIPYAGLAATFETSGNGVYKKLPDRYSDRKYYKMSAFHANVFAGAKLRMPVGTRQRQRLELYAETGTVDSYLYYYLKNSSMNFTDMFSMALGMSYHFGNK
jgi:hypothetical protein